MGYELSQKELEDFSQTLPVDGEPYRLKCIPFRIMIVLI
jgi:hypothetical protein